MSRRVLFIAMSVVVASLIGTTRPVSTHETVNTTVLFDREIVKVLNSHCVMCHVEGGPAFPLAAYEDVWLQRRKISAAVLARRMPPWPSMSGYGRFANENVVTLRESQFLVSWMEGLGPRNSGKVFTNTAIPGATSTAAVRAHTDFNSWPIGTPDLMRDLVDVVIESNQPDDEKRSIVDLGLTAERSVKGVEFLPGDRRVVRAAFFTIQETGQWLGSWTPWYGFTKLPDGVVFRLPAGSHVAADVFYQHRERRVVDHGKLGLVFDARSAAKTASDLIVNLARDESNDKGRLHGQVAIGADTTLLAMRPVSTDGMSSLEVKALRPDGGSDILLFAKDFSSKWPTPFVFAEPVILHRGTTFSATAYGSRNAPPSSVRLIVSVVR